MCVLQLIAEENQVRLELQMTLDSKDSDLEQLRCQLTSLSVHSLDSTSISSGNDLDVGDAYPGRRRRLPLALVIWRQHIHSNAESQFQTHVRMYFLPPSSCTLFFLFPLFSL